MTELHNYNQSAIHSQNSPQNKSSISVNVYTKEDDAIIKRILQDPNWTVTKIQNALPYQHSTKNIMNKLLQFCSQEEIDSHLADATPKPVARARRYWTKAELDLLSKYADQYSLTDPAWQELIPNHTPKAIADKLWRIRHAASPKPKRIRGWLASDIELLKLAMSDLDRKPLPELMQDIINSLDEKHTANEINEMVKALKLVKSASIKEKPKEMKETKEMTETKEMNTFNTPTSTAPTTPVADDKFVLLSQLHALVEKFPKNVIYNIHVDFGSGIHFDLAKPRRR